MRLQLSVLYHDHTTLFYPIGPRRAWKVDGPSRCLVIGHGVPRTYVPLDQVRSFGIDFCAVVTGEEPRCPSCDHPTESHSGDGCWYAVTEAAVGRDLMCPCSLPNGVERYGVAMPDE